MRAMLARIRAEKKFDDVFLSSHFPQNVLVKKMKIGQYLVKIWTVVDHFLTVPKQYSWPYFVTFPDCSVM